MDLSSLTFSPEELSFLGILIAIVALAAFMAGKSWRSASRRVLRGDSRSGGGQLLRLEIPFALGQEVSFDSPQPDRQRKGTGTIHAVTVDRDQTLYFEVLTKQNGRPVIEGGILAEEIRG